MRLLILFFSICLFMKEQTVFDFHKDCEMKRWRIVNDDVMGGISSSSISLNDEFDAVFSGAVSTENNGGFAMTQASVSVEVPSDATRIKLRVKGDGKQYQFRIKSALSQRYWYVKSFETSNNWEEIVLNLKDFYPSFRGYRLNKDNFSSDSIEKVAILIGNKKNEDFKLTIDHIKIN